MRDETLRFGYLTEPASPEALAAEALGYVDESYTTVYLMAGLGAQTDGFSLRAVRQAIGDHGRIRIDATEAWDAGPAIQMIRQLEPFEVECRALPAWGSPWTTTK